MTGIYSCNMKLKNIKNNIKKVELNQRSIISNQKKREETQ